VIRRIAISLAWLAFGLALSEAMWRFWTPRCTEGTCAAWIGASMIGTCLVGPPIWMLAGFISSRPPSPVLKGSVLKGSVLFAGCLLLNVAIALFLTVSL
jgi:hypothetical protein